MLFDIHATFPVERPVMEIRGDGWTPNFQAINLNPRIVQVEDILWNHPADNIGVRILLKEIVVARYENLVPGFQVAEPI